MVARQLSGKRIQARQLQSSTVRRTSSQTAPSSTQSSKNKQQIEAISRQQRELARLKKNISFRSPQFRGSVRNRRRQAAKAINRIESKIRDLAIKKFRLAKGRNPGDISRKKGSVKSIQEVLGRGQGVSSFLKKQETKRKSLREFRSKQRLKIEKTTDIPEITKLKLTDPRLKQLILKESPRLRSFERKAKKEDKRAKINLFVKSKNGSEVIIAEKGKENGTSGSFIAVEKPKGTIDRHLFNLREKSRRISSDIERKKITGFEKQLKGTVLQGAIGVGVGALSFAKFVKNPIDTAKAQFEALRPKNFFKTIKGIKQEFEINPVGVMAEFYGFGKSARIAGNTVRTNPLVRTVQEEVFIARQPKELRPAVRAIVKSSKVQEKINPFNVKTIRNIDFAEIKELNKIEARAMRNAIIKTDSVIFGSVAARTLSKKRTPIPKDIDLATKDISKFNKVFMDFLPKNKRGLYFVKGQKIIRRKDGAAIADVKPLSRIVPQRSFLTRRGRLPAAGYVRRLKINKKGINLKRKIEEGVLEVPTQKLQKVGAIRLVGFGEQTTRKALGTLQVLLEKNSRRAKDPQAFLISLEIQKKTISLKKPRTPIGRLNKRRKLKIINSAIKVFKSKSFSRLLENNVRGISKDFPLVAKIDLKKLKKLRPVVKRKTTGKRIKKTNKLSKKTTNKIKKTKRTFKKKTTRPKRRSSSIVPSRLSKSKIPSRLKSKIPSRVPSRLGSKDAFKNKVQGSI